jgi:hypothetical protein
MFGGVKVFTLFCVMITITGYTKQSYTNIQRLLHKAFADSEKKEIQIAAAIGLNSPNTVKNAFDINKQRVSDKVLTDVTKAVGLNMVVVWENGTRHYYTQSL